MWNWGDHWLNLLLSSVLFILRLVEFSFSVYYIKNWLIFRENLLRKLIILLRFFILVSIILVSYNEMRLLAGKKLAILLFLLIFTITFFFLIRRIVVLYTLFEISLIPIFIIIIGWGYQIERLNASMRIIFYTLTASLPLLVMLLFFSRNLNSRLISRFFNCLVLNNVISLFFTIAFLVKTPMFLVHLWLPKAHVEAPVYGSIILAALLLKLGTYGLYHFFYLAYLRSFLTTIFRISFIRCFLVRFACLRMLDLKVVIAYSSVAHIALVIFLFLLLNSLREMGGVGIMLTHGITSAPLFYLAYILYERRHRRSLILNKSIVNFIPRLSFIWFLILMLNMAAPPSLNLLVELFIVINIMNQVKLLVVGLIICIIAGTAYSLIIYSSINQTQDSLRSNKRPISVKELWRTLIYLPPGLISILVTNNFL